MLHAPEAGRHGHVHYIELDQFIGPNWLVTVHGPLGEGVDPAAAQTETGRCCAASRPGGCTPTSAAELSYALVTALTGRLRDFLSALTEEVWRLEQTGHGRAPRQRRGLP